MVSNEHGIWFLSIHLVILVKIDDEFSILDLGITTSKSQERHSPAMANEDGDAPLRIESVPGDLVQKLTYRTKDAPWNSQRNRHKKII